MLGVARHEQRNALSRRDKRAVAVGKLAKRAPPPTTGHRPKMKPTLKGAQSSGTPAGVRPHCKRCVKHHELEVS